VNIKLHYWERGTQMHCCFENYDGWGKNVWKYQEMRA